jgi:hypothetical protein
MRRQSYAAYEGLEGLYLSYSFILYIILQKTPEKVSVRGRVMNFINYGEREMAPSPPYRPVSLSPPYPPISQGSISSYPSPTYA